MTDDIKPFPLITNAIRQGKMSEMIDLFHRFPEMKNLDVPGFGNWLIYSSAHGTVDIVEYLINSGFLVNNRDKRSEQNALSSAALCGRIDIVEMLIKMGASFETDSSLINPLFASIIGKSPSVAMKLLDAGVDTTLRYPFGGDVKNELDAVAFAMMHGQREIAHSIALKNSRGDECAAQAAMAAGLKLAKLVTVAGGTE